MATIARIRPTSQTSRHVVVWLLAIVYTFNFVDRQIMSVLQEPIRHEMGLSDTQLGMLTGLTFALFYTTCGIPIAWLSDRWRRVWIMAAACGIWSMFTIACGMARNFTELATARVMVGMGEAGGSPPAYSLLSDYFPPGERGRALGIYSLGVPAGSALGVAAGGWIAANYSWHAAFVAVGLPGLFLALLLLLIREPERGALDGTADRVALAAKRTLNPWQEFFAFFTNRTLLLLSISSGLSAFLNYATLSWNPSLLERVKGMSLTEIAGYYSIVLGVAGAAGTFGAGWLVDRLGRKDGRWYSWVPALAFACAIPALAGIVWAPTWQLALGFVAIVVLLNSTYLAPALTLVQNATPPSRRTLAGATLLFMLNLIGLAGGPVYVGYISDIAKPHFGNHSLLAGYAALGPVILATIVAHLLVARSIRLERVLATSSETENRT